MVWPGVSSSTMDPKVAQEFFRSKHGAVGSMFILNARPNRQSRGRDISALSALPNERVSLSFCTAVSCTVHALLGALGSLQARRAPSIWRSCLVLSPLHPSHPHHVTFSSPKTSLFLYITSYTPTFFLKQEVVFRYNSWWRVDQVLNPSAKKLLASQIGCNLDNVQVRPLL